MVVLLSAAAFAGDPPLAAGAPVVLFQGSGHVASPRFSADGRALAFEVVGVSDDQLWVLAAEGRADPVELPRGARFGSAAWHPEGHLVFSATMEGGGDRLYYRSGHGGASAELFTARALPGRLESPSFDPSGQRMALTVDGRLAVGPPGDVQRLDEVRDVGLSAWSPDGSRLAFERRESGQVDLHVRDADGVRPLREGPGDQVRPAWAAGGRVVHFSGDAGRWALDVIDADGSTRRIASDVRLPHRAPPAVSPDGAWVVWASEAPAHASALFLAPVAGGTPSTLQTGAPWVGEPAITEVAGVERMVFAATIPGSPHRALVQVDLRDDRIALPPYSPSSNVPQ